MTILLARLVIFIVDKANVLLVLEPHVVDEFVASVLIQSKYWFVANSGGEAYHRWPTYAVIAGVTILLAILAVARTKQE